MNIEKSNINRLIIIGNGFDLNLKLPTSYKDFLWGLIEYIVDNKAFYARNPSPLFNTKGAIRKDIKEFALSYVINEFFEFKSPMLKIAYDEIDKKNWTDLERIYYSELIKIYESIILNQDDNEEQIYLSKLKSLNQELSEITLLLSKYLKRVVNEHRLDIGSLEEYYARFACPFNSEDFDDATFAKQKSEIENKIPSKVLILNFNYTELFKHDFVSAYWNDIEQDFTVLNIHGKMSNPDSMVFGYGDEFDDRYNKIEAIGEDEWLKNFKSFKYFKNKDYDKLLGFIESSDFQTWIVGHSCGLSDKTLLNQIFENDHCINIKAFYHKKKSANETIDNFDEICYSISRIMKNKPKMRQIVTKKNKGCRFINLN